MSTVGPVEPVKRRWRFRLVFIVALALTVASQVLGFGLPLYFQQFFQNVFQTGGDNLIQQFFLVESTVNFVLNPVICFFIFYKIASRISIKILSDHFHLLANSFAGGLVGYAVGYLILIAYELIIFHSGNVAGPNTDWLVWSGQLVLGILRGGVDMAFLAFAGVVVGGLRSAVPGMSVTHAESVAPAPNTDGSV